MTLARSLLLGSALAMMITGASGKDLQVPVVDPAIDYASASYFEGFYAGLYAGGAINNDNNLHVGADYLNLWHDNRFNLGVLAGYNFQLAECFLAGVELQAGSTFNMSRQSGFEGLALARVGYVLYDTFLVYAVGGVGHYSGTGVFAVGGGIEAGLGDGLGIRFELLGLGELGANQIPGHVPDIHGISATKFSFSALWHLN